MTAEADRSWQEAEATRFRERLRGGLKARYIRLRRGARWLWQHLPFRHGFSSLTRRIVILNLIGLAILVSGILYLNQFREGLIDARVESLLTQAGLSAELARARAQILYWAFLGFALSDHQLPKARQQAVLDELLRIAAS